MYPFSPPRPAKTSPVIQAASVPYKIKCVASGALCATGFRSEWKLYGTGWNARRGGGPRTDLTGPYSRRISRPHTRITVFAPSPSYPISLAVFCVSRIKGVMLAPGPLVAAKEVERTVAICQKLRSRPGSMEPCTCVQCLLRPSPASHISRCGLGPSDSTQCPPECREGCRQHPDVGSIFGS